MHSTYYTHTFDAYLLHVSILVYDHQGQQLRQLLENPTAFMTALSMGSIL